MYNGQRIIELLELHRLQHKDLLSHLKLRENGSISRFVKGDIKVSRLEQIADFFGVSIDTFFDRSKECVNSSVVILGDHNNGNDMSFHGNASATSRSREFEARAKSLERELKTKDELIAEKERTIELLETMVDMLRNQLNS